MDEGKLEEWIGPELGEWSGAEIVKAERLLIDKLVADLDKVYQQLIKEEHGMTHEDLTRILEAFDVVGEEEAN
jgi:hypothetical protein